MGTNFEYSFVRFEKKRPNDIFFKKSKIKSVFLKKLKKINWSVPKMVRDGNNLHFNGKTFSSTLIFRHFYAQFLDLRFKPKISMILSHSIITLCAKYSIFSQQKKLSEHS